MFDIGFPELMVVSVVALLILGPERLPETLRTLGLWLGRLRRSFAAIKTELEDELGMDDIRRQLHNESVMKEMERIEAEVKNSLDAEDAEATAASERQTENSIAPPQPAATGDTSQADNPTKSSAATDSPAPVADTTKATNDRANH